MEDKIKQQAEQIIEKIKGIVKDGQASHISLKRKGETVFSISLNAGILGAVIGLKAAPMAVLTAALITFGLDCEIEIEKKDGTIINLNETRVGSKMADIKETVKSKAKDIFGEGYEVSATVDAEEDAPETDTADANKDVSETDVPADAPAADEEGPAEE